MEERKIFPDFNKLKGFRPKLTDDQITLIKTHGFVFQSQYFDYDYCSYLADRFVDIAKRYDLENHYNDLLFIILELNDELQILEGIHTQKFKGTTA